MLWFVVISALFFKADAFSNRDVPEPEFGFNPGVIWLAVPKTTADMSLAAIHLTVGEPVPGTQPGKFNKDLEREGNFFRGSVHYNWQTGDTIYYWVYVIVGGLGYQRLNQKHVIRATNASPVQQSPVQRPVARPSGPFEVPTPRFHLSPYTITVTVPALPGVSLVAIHFSLNVQVPGVQAGQFNQDLQLAGDTYVAVFTVPQWKAGDVIHYWVYAIYEGLGKHKLGQRYVIPHQDGTVPDTMQPPAVTPADPSLHSVHLPENCGNRPAFDFLRNLEDGSPRVHGGVPATDGEYPWQAQLLKLEGTSYSHLCGGIIISERHVLTAAHCVTDLTERRLQVVVAQYDRRTSDDPGQQTFAVQQLQRHGRYSPDRLVGYANDIALLLLRPIGGRGIRFNDYVQPLCLPSGTEELTEFTACLVSGWGRRDGSREFPNLLHGGMVPYVTSSYCATEEVWGGLYNETVHLCAGFTAGGGDAVDACEGDSGGPLTCQDAQGRWRATGIVSWGSPECRALPVYVGVYTRVSSYIGWIVRTLDYLCEEQHPCP